MRFRRTGGKNGTTRDGATRGQTREAWVESALLAIGEVAGTAEDMLRPHAKRELGPAVHRRLVSDGITSLRTLIDHLPAQ